MNLNEHINTKQYNQYLADLNTYYLTKNNYEIYKNKLKNNILNKHDLNIEDKKKEFSKLKFKCINCKKDGGTIFNETTDILHMTCGNISNPCKIDLKIERNKYLNLENEILFLKYKLYNIKKSILLIKLNLLFNYISEDKAVELFNEQNSELNNYQELYYQYLEKYKEIVNKNEITELIQNQEQLINDIKEFNILYKSTKKDNYLIDAHNLYINELKKLNEEIFKIKYNNSYIEKNNETGVFKLNLKKIDTNKFIYINTK